MSTTIAAGDAKVALYYFLYIRHYSVVYVVVDLYHFIISFCRHEIMIIFVFFSGEVVRTKTKTRRLIKSNTK